MAPKAASRTSSSNNDSSHNGAAPSKEIPLPALLQFWRSLATSLPKLQIFGLDISLTVATVLFLSSLSFLARYILVNQFHWPADEMATKDAAASAVSIVHSLSLVPALFLCFLYHPYNPSEPLQQSSVPMQEVVVALLQFCTGYMVYDGLLNIVILHWSTLNAEDLMFLGHHIATTVYMTSTRIVQAGHMSALMCMFLGESTNPLQNSHLMAQKALTLACCNGSRMQAAHDWVELLFSAMYFVVRTVIAFVACTHMTYHLWRYGRKHIPSALIAFWTFLIWAVLAGSIPWIQTCWGVMEKNWNEGLPPSPKQIVISSYDTVGSDEL
jgi:hypothetical protein